MYLWPIFANERQKKVDYVLDELEGYASLRDDLW
jgi:hypothetical protein